VSRCRFCGKAGHNKLSCPSVAEYAAKAKIAISNGSSKYDLDWYARHALHIEESKNARKEARKIAGPSATPRKCSYCSEAGHTRATCATLKSDKTTMFALEKRYRAAISKYIASTGLGVGAIVTRDPESFSNTFSILVTGFSPSNLSLLTAMGNGANFRGTFLDRENWVGEATNFMFASNTGLDNPFMSRYPYIIAAHGAPAEFPSNWLDDSEIENRLSVWFDEKASRRDRWSDTNKGAFFNSRPNIQSCEVVVQNIEKFV
jgi:hypothetical protein